jgi:hypothetical protein
MKKSDVLHIFVFFYVSGLRVRFSLAGKKTPLFAMTELKLSPYKIFVEFQCYFVWSNP